MDIPALVLERIQTRNDPKYTLEQIDRLRGIYADLDKVSELLVETKGFCGSLSQLQELKVKVKIFDTKVLYMPFWKHQPLKQRIITAKLELQDALRTIGCAEVLLQDVKNALLLVDKAIHNKKLKDLNPLQNKMACLEKKLANYLTESTLPVNLKSEVDGTLEMLHARQEQVNAVVAAFETFMEVILNVDKVDERVKKLQTVKDVNEVLNQIDELLNFCKEFETLDNTTLSGMKDFTHKRLKCIEEHTSNAKEFLTIREELDTETVAVNDLANQINEFWGTMAELQILKQQIHEKKNALFKFSSVENSQLKSILDQTLKMLSDSKNLLEDRAVLIEGQSCQDGPEEESNLEADKPPDLSKMLSESRSMEDIGKLTFQLLSVHRQLSDKTVSIEQGKWLKKQLVECDSLLEHMKLKSPDERKYQTQALEFCRKLQTQVKEAMKLKQDVPVNVSSIALTALGRARWLEVQLMDCQTRLDAIDLPEGVAREARRDVLNLCNEALKSLNALAAQHNW
ncbi:hypothetical protein B566_EDAN006917 [Ephemera danica]|nr:hypothetical protein B566_EDAN006917 [Ephemera danica]